MNYNFTQFKSSGSGYRGHCSVTIGKKYFTLSKELRKMIKTEKLFIFIDKENKAIALKETESNEIGVLKISKGYVCSSSLWREIGTGRYFFKEKINDMIICTKEDNLKLK